MALNLNIRDRVDSTLRKHTDVGLSNDFTSMEDSGGFVNTFQGGVDATIDNDHFSVQDTYRDTFVEAPMEGVASLRAGQEVDLTDEQIGQAWAAADDQLTAGIDNAIEGTRFEDSAALDVTRSLSDATLGEAARNVIGTTAGIDTQSGGTEFETGPWAAFDTASLGGGALAARGATRGLMSLRNSDEAAGLTSRVASQFGDNARKTGDLSEDIGGYMSRFMSSSDEASDARAAQNVDDPLSLTGYINDGADDAEDVGSAFSRSVDDAADETGLVPYQGGDDVDDAGSAFSRSVDDAADETGLVPYQGGDDAEDVGSAFSRSVDDAADDAEDVGSAFSRSVDDAADDADDTTGYFGLFDQPDDGLGAFNLNRASGGADDAGSAFSRGADDAADTTSSGADDAGSAFSRGADDADDTTAATRLEKSGSTPASVTMRNPEDVDDGIRTLGDRLRNLAFGTRKRQLATGATGLFGGAVATEEILETFGGNGDPGPLSDVHDVLNDGLEDGEQEVQTKGGRSLMLREQEMLDPTDDYPTGGVLVEIEEFDPQGDYSEIQGYGIILDQAGNTLSILSSSGKVIQAEMAATTAAAAQARAEGGYYDQ